MKTDQSDLTDPTDLCVLGEGMCFLKKGYVVFVTLLLMVSAMLIGPVAWRWGKREFVRIQSRGQWEKLCTSPSADVENGDPCGWLKIPSCGIDTVVLLGGSKANLAKSVCMESVGQGCGCVGEVDSGISNNQIVHESFGPSVLLRSPAHSAGCTGRQSLRVLSGHRDTHFRKLRSVEEGDAVELCESDGSLHCYRVAGIDIIPKGKLDDYFVGQNHPGWIALLTCYPFRYIGPAPERFVVWCEPES